MKKHFVIFRSPGTFVHEESEFPIESWDVKKASDMAHSITERRGATPFGFYFTTRGRAASELDSKVIKESPMYYLGGRVMSAEDVEREMPDEKILVRNMKGNGWEKIIVNTNSWRVAQPLNKDDVVLDWKPRRKKK